MIDNQEYASISQRLKFTQGTQQVKLSPRLENDEIREPPLIDSVLEIDLVDVKKD